MFRTNVRRLGALGAAGVVLAIAFPGAAQAAHVGCGSVITTDTVLDSDIGPCASDGVIAGASGITIDLNGHSVSGTPGAGNDGVGVRIAEHSEVTVTNGTIQHFDAGVAIIKGAKNTVSGVTVRDNVGNPATSDFGDGIALASTSNNTIVNNTIERNGPFSGVSVFQLGAFALADEESQAARHSNGSGGAALKNVIQGNTIRDNNIRRCGTTRCINADIGVRLEPGSKQNTVTANTITGSGLDGIQVFGTSIYNTITSNNVNGNGFNIETHRKGSGILVGRSADNNTVASNTVNLNAVDGISLAPISGFNTVVHNTALNNNVTMSPTGFDLEDGTLSPPCGNNFWGHNTYGTRNQACVN